MSNLQKFNNTLDDLDQEVRQLKEVSTVYKKIQRQTEICNEIIKQFEENTNILSNINELQNTQIKSVSKNLIESVDLHKRNKIELAKIIEEKTDLIRKENKEFYKELEATIKIKLDENLFQVKQLIESERNQIKQIFEIEFVKNTNELKLIIEKEINRQTGLLLNDQQSIKIWLWSIGTLCLILGGLTVFKLWIV